MCVAVPEMSASQVLSAFHRDAPYLFLGAAFAAVGIISAAFAVLSGRRNSLLIFFALFAAFYGLRLWIWSILLGITVQESIFYIRLRGAVNYIILIPGVSVLHYVGSAETI
jgi:sigma-B regulation protein RsbU (phosphoserine phosphatase)